MDLYKETMKLVRKSRLPIQDICDATGLKIRWYYKLLEGHFADPGVKKIQKIYNFLKK